MWRHCKTAVDRTNINEKMNLVKDKQSKLQIKYGNRMGWVVSDVLRNVRQKALGEKKSKITSQELNKVVLSRP